MRVLEEVGGFFLDQAIGVFVLGIHAGLLFCVCFKVCCWLSRRRDGYFAGLSFFLAANPGCNHPSGTNQGGDAHGRSMG